MRSDFLKLNWRDLLHSVVIVVATPIGAFVVTMLTKLINLMSIGQLPTISDLPTLKEVSAVVIMSIGAGLAYLMKQLFTNSQGQLKTGV